MTVTKEQLEYNAHLLEIIRNCGLFKCTDCLYALWEDRGYGMEYKCCAPHTLPHSAWNYLETAMRGSACFAFEPSGEAKSHLVERMTKTRDAVNELWKYARDKTERTASGGAQAASRTTSTRASTRGSSARDAARRW